jgi:hypothetical protein
MTAFGVLTPAHPILTLVGAANTKGPVFLQDNRDSRLRSGYKIQFRDGYGSGGSALSDDGWNHSDQGHHFAAFFQLGYNAGLLASAGPLVYELWQGTLTNQGDINLGNVAVNLGRRIRSGELKPYEVAGEILRTLCD